MKCPVPLSHTLIEPASTERELPPLPWQIPAPRAVCPPSQCSSTETHAPGQARVPAEGALTSASPTRQNSLVFAKTELELLDIAAGRGPGLGLLPILLQHLEEQKTCGQVIQRWFLRTTA